MSDITLVDPSESYSVSLNIFVDDKDIDKIVLLIINNFMKSKKLRGLPASSQKRIRLTTTVEKHKNNKIESYAISNVAIVDKDKELPLISNDILEMYVSSLDGQEKFKKITLDSIKVTIKVEDNLSPTIKRVILGKHAIIEKPY